MISWINNSIYKLIKNGKNLLLDNVTNNIKNELKDQNNSIEKLEKYIENWKENYNKKDFSKMSQAYEKIEKEFNKIIPIENIIKETRKVESIHNLIKNNGQNFNITEEEKRLAYNFSS